jgi:hypothetical protein
MLRLRRVGRLWRIFAVGVRFGRLPVRRRRREIFGRLSVHLRWGSLPSRRAGERPLGFGRDAPLGKQARVFISARVHRNAEDFGLLLALVNLAAMCLQLCDHALGGGGAVAKRRKLLLNLVPRLHDPAPFGVDRLKLAGELVQRGTTVGVEFEIGAIEPSNSTAPTRSSVPPSGGSKWMRASVYVSQARRKLACFFV